MVWMTNIETWNNLKMIPFEQRSCANCKSKMYNPFKCNKCKLYRSLNYKNMPFAQHPGSQWEWDGTTY